MKEKKTPRRFLIVLFVFFLLVFLISVVQVLRYFWSGRQAEQVAVQFSQAVKLTPPVQTEAAASQPQGAAEETEAEAEKPPIEVDFDQLQAFNPDIMGWLYLPDSAINYPVMRSRDNADYLHHLPDGTYNTHGSIFMDCHNALDLTDDNIILYGHSMQDGSMFGRLENFREQDYYDTHQNAYLLTPDKNYLLEIFAAYVTDAGSDVYSVLYSNQGKIDMLRRAVAQSDVVTTPRVTSEDTIVTLSTCAFYFDEARYVVMAVLKEW